MEASDLRPCDKCGDRLDPTWYIIKLSQCMSTPNGIVVMGETMPSMWTDLLVWQSCVLGMKGDAEIDLGELISNEMEREK